MPKIGKRKRWQRALATVIAKINHSDFKRFPEDIQLRFLASKIDLEKKLSPIVPKKT